MRRELQQLDAGLVGDENELASGWDLGGINYDAEPLSGGGTTWVQVA